MRSAFRCVLMVLAISALPVAPTSAERWIEPEPLQPAPGQDVMLRLMEGEPGEPLQAAERPYSRSDANLFQRLWKSGRKNLGSREGARPAATFRPDAAGVQIIAFSSKIGKPGTDGKRRVWYGKAVVVVGDAPEKDPIRWSELGQRLEIVPQTDPSALARRGGTLEVQVLFEREPLAGVTVTATPRTSPGDARQAITDEIGLARFPLDRSGAWLVRVEHGRVRETLSATLLLPAGGGAR